MIEIEEKLTVAGSTVALKVKVISLLAGWLLVPNEVPLQPSEHTEIPNSWTLAPLLEEDPQAAKRASRQEVARILLRDGSIFRQ
jgi:hypothetical protein